MYCSWDLHLYLYFVNGTMKRFSFSPHMLDVSEHKRLRYIWPTHVMRRFDSVRKDHLGWYNKNWANKVYGCEVNRNIRIAVIKSSTVSIMHKNHPKILFIWDIFVLCPSKRPDRKKSNHVKLWWKPGDVFEIAFTPNIISSASIASETFLFAPYNENRSDTWSSVQWSNDWIGLDLPFWPTKKTSDLVFLNVLDSYSYKESGSFVLSTFWSWMAFFDPAECWWIPQCFPLSFLGGVLCCQAKE